VCCQAHTPRARGGVKSPIPRVPRVSTLALRRHVSAAFCWCAASSQNDSFLEKRSGRQQRMKKIRWQKARRAKRVNLAFDLGSKGGKDTAPISDMCSQSIQKLYVWSELRRSPSSSRAVSTLSYSFLLDYPRMYDIVTGASIFGITDLTAIRPSN
jgi:hypothetical protein